MVLRGWNVAYSAMENTLRRCKGKILFLSFIALFLKTFRVTLCISWIEAEDEGRDLSNMYLVHKVGLARVNRVKK